MALSGNQKTRLGLSGITRKKLGDFTGKEGESFFIGSGILLYSKDEKYYQLNTGETSPTTS